MCGRISCHMCRPDYRKATSFFDEAQGYFVQPDWIDEPNCGLNFTPSTNIAPSEILPVIISNKGSPGDSTSRVIKPMMWGMVPPWHQGDYKSHGLTTNNCRIENLPESKLYSKPLRNGQRCVISVQGFYEWQTTKGKGQAKQPYFIKSPQSPDVGPVEDLSSWEKGSWDKLTGWNGPKLLQMAGLYDMWSSPQGDVMYSFTIITMESNETFSWLHHRVPAILDNEELINKWLDTTTVPGLAAVKLLQPVSLLSWHPVSTAVNNARNKHPDCNKPVDLQKPKPTNKIMDSWLKRKAPSTDESPAKKTKD